MKTIAKNLMIGFIKESQSRTRYEMYAEIAKKEKYTLISTTFKELANHEKENANSLYIMLQQLKKDEFLEDIIVEIKCATTYGTTKDNLESSIKVEDENWLELYPNFANTAEVEGYLEIAKKLRKISQLKRNNSQRLKMFLNLIVSDTYFKKKAITFWKCMACGYEVAIDDLANDFSCPSCGHLKSYFKKKTLQLIQEEKFLEQKASTGWVCMECGYEAALEELPDDWKCVSCGRSKAYFKRKILKQTTYKISTIQTEKAHWKCLECGNEEEIELPAGWKCRKCGYPKDLKI